MAKFIVHLFCVCVQGMDVCLATVRPQQQLIAEEAITADSVMAKVYCPSVLCLVSKAWMRV